MCKHAYRKLYTCIAIGEYSDLTFVLTVSLRKINSLKVTVQALTDELARLKPNTV